jgi:histone deacetylase 4/5
MFPFGNEQLYASSGSGSDGEDVDELYDAVRSVNVIQAADDVLGEHLLKMKLDEDSLAMKTTSSSLSAEQHPTNSVEGHNEASVVLSNRISDLSFTWRSVLSRTYVWYASFGSNMWKPRFLCYIQGGKVKLNNFVFSRGQ